MIYRTESGIGIDIMVKLELTGDILDVRVQIFILRKRSTEFKHIFYRFPYKVGSLFHKQLIG